MQKKMNKKWLLGAVILLLLTVGMVLIFTAGNAVQMQEQNKVQQNSEEDVLQRRVAQWVQIIHYETQQVEGALQVAAEVRMPDYPRLLQLCCEKVAKENNEDLELQIEQVFDEFQKMLKDSDPEQSMNITFTVPEADISEKEIETAIRQEAMMQMMSQAYMQVMMSCAPIIDEMEK